MNPSTPSFLFLHIFSRRVTASSRSVTQSTQRILRTHKQAAKFTKEVQGGSILAISMLGVQLTPAFATQRGRLALFPTPSMNIWTEITENQHRLILNYAEVVHFYLRCEQPGGPGSKTSTPTEGTKHCPVWMMFCWGILVHRMGGRSAPDKAA